MTYQVSHSHMRPSMSADPDPNLILNRVRIIYQKRKKIFLEKEKMRKERAPYGRPYPKSESALALPNMPEREYQMAHVTKNGKSGGCSRIDRAVESLRATLT